MRTIKYATYNSTYILYNFVFFSKNVNCFLGFVVLWLEKYRVSFKKKKNSQQITDKETIDLENNLKLCSPPGKRLIFFFLSCW